LRLCLKKGNTRKYNIGEKLPDLGFHNGFLDDTKTTGNESKTDKWYCVKTKAH
jgi:hypothetical protein